MLLIGLTGGIACGKTTVAKILSELYSYQIIDLDVLSEKAAEPGTSAHKVLVKTFPAAVGPDGNINRDELSKIVFADKIALKKLNGIMKMPIAKALFSEIGKHYWGGTRFLVLDTPLLFESGLDKICSCTISVTLENEEMQLQRLMGRDGLQDEPKDQGKSVNNQIVRSGKSITEPEARARINSQMPMAEKRKRSTYDINNSASLEELKEQIANVVSIIPTKHNAILPRNSLLTYLLTAFLLLLAFLANRYL